MSNRLFHFSPRTIAGLYLVFGALWILTTDSLLFGLFQSAETVTVLQTIKGWVFVGLSALLVFGLSAVHTRQYEASERRLETASEQLQVLHRFFRHNIRNDLNVVLAHTEMAAADAPELRDEASLETVQRKTRNIIRMSEKLRMANDIDIEGAGDYVDLADVIEDSLHSIERKYPELDLSPEIPDNVSVRGDYTVGEVLVELVENAIQHNPNPPAECTVSIDVEQRGDTVTVEVRDDGPGIDRKEIETLESESETDLTHTSGVGLWMVKWVCECHGGDLEIETDDADGTAVTLTFERATPSMVGESLSGPLPDPVGAMG